MKQTLYLKDLYMGKTKKNVAKQTKDVDHIEKVSQWLQSPTLFTKQGESERVKK